MNFNLKKISIIGLVLVAVFLGASLSFSIKAVGLGTYLKSLKFIGSGTAASYMVGTDGGSMLFITPGGECVDDTSSNLTIGGDATLFILSANVTVDGTQVGAWKWYYSSIFPDLSGYGHTAYPGFRTESSDNLTASIEKQQAYVEAAEPPGEESMAWEMLTDAEKERLKQTPLGLYREGGTDFPGGDTVQRTSDKLRFPVEVLLYPLAILSSIGAGVWVMKKTHRPEKGIRGSLFLQAITSLFLMACWVAIGGGVISGWILIPFGIWAIVALIFRNPYNPVTS